MPRYRKRPVEVEAYLWDPDGDDDAHADILGWLIARKAPISHHAGQRIAIETLEGTMFAEPGDYIICGVKGEFYPCKPDIFEATYEQVDERRGGFPFPGPGFLGLSYPRNPWGRR